MYLQHFGLKEVPFSLTPNTDFFLGLPSHVEALQVLQIALQTGEGFIKVTGEVGTGKTLICRKLINELPDNYRCAYLPNPFLSPAEMRWAVALELGLTFSADIDQLQLSILIQQQLLALSGQGLSIVMVLDEAQALPDETLEALRLFTNLETEKRKLIQVVLFGQPELDQRLKQDKFRQLRQRITFSYSLRPLNNSEGQAYIQHRLAKAGRQGQPLFTGKQTAKITTLARGIPRLINILAHKSLMLSYGEGKAQVLDRHLRAAAVDTIDVQGSTKHTVLWMLGASLLIVATLTGYYFYFGVTP